MKLKNIVLAVILFAGLTSVSAQNFRVGEQVVNIGLGIGSNLGGGLPISVSYDNAFKDGVLDKGLLSWGGLIGFATYKYEAWTNYGFNYTYWVIGGRIALHYPIIENRKLDTYVGLMLAYNIVNSSTYGKYTGLMFHPNTSYMGLGGFIGARYYFNNNFSGIAELGYGIAYLNLGVGYKF